MRMSDGPTGPLPGGAFRTGTLVSDTNVDWTGVLKGNLIELQLVNPAGSRTTGAFVYKGQLYVPCDLGFFWRRLPSARGRWMASVLWFFKRWHLDAENDGRVVLRVDGKLYEREAVRITDTQLLGQLRLTMEDLATPVMEKRYGAPLLPVKVNPEDIWFFRLDPRETE